MKANLEVVTNDRLQRVLVAELRHVDKLLDRKTMIGMVRL